jgi:hypothetical protein
MEVVHSSQTLVPAYQITLRHIEEDRNIHRHHWQNVGYHQLEVVLSSMLAVLYILEAVHKIVKVGVAAILCFM